MINPKRHDCTYPDKHLAGVGVALKLVQALCTRAGKAKWLPGFVKIAALGTLADVVPLVGENRVIARFGLESLSRGPHTVGLRSLLDASGLDRQDDRQLSGRVHGRAARQRRRPHEQARHRDAAAAGHRRSDGRGSARAGAAAERREPAPAAGGSRARQPGEEGDRNRPGGRRAQRPRRRRRGLASRRHRHRRVEARRHVSQAGDRPVGRRRRRPRLVPQHPRLQHARRRSSTAPTCSSASAVTSRPPA